MESRFLKLYIIVILVVLSIGCNTNNSNRKAFWSDDKSPDLIGMKITNDLLNRGDFMMYISDHCTAVHYAEACAAFGAARLAGLLNDSIIISKISERYLRVITDSITNTANHVDANVYGILPLELYLQTGSEIYFKQGIELADLQWINPLPDGLTNQTRYWIDDIWMIGSLQVQAFRATGNAVYLDRAALEIDSYLHRLQQSNGFKTRLAVQAESLNPNTPKRLLSVKLATVMINPIC